MANFKRFYSAVEAAEKIMTDWSDEEDDNIDMVMLPTENVYVVTDDEQIADDGDKIDNGLRNDVCGTSQLQANISEIEENLAYDDNISDFEISKREERALNQLIGENFIGDK